MKTKRRAGIGGIMRREDLDAIGRGERMAAVLLREPTARLRRRGDPPATIRVPDLSTVRVVDWLGLVVDVRGYVNGREDTGLRCRACPLSDLEEVEA